MKFTLQNGVMGYIGPKAEEGTLLDKINNFSDMVIGKEVEFIFAPIIKGIGETLVNFGHWLLINLPDIMGYVTIAAGVFIILGAMFGKGGIIKPMGIWSGLMILAICILGGV